MTVHAISGLCGSGKTTEMIRRISESNHNRHIVVVPSRDLCVEIQGKLKDNSVSAVVINSDTHTNTTASIVQHLSTFTGVEKHVLVITHSSFRLMDISVTSGWSVWHDELPSLFQNQKVWNDPNVPFESYFNVAEDKTISLTNLALSSDNHDSLNSDMKGLIHGLKSGRYTAYAVSDTTENNGKRYVNVMTILSPSYFPDNTTLLSAGVEESLVYKLLLKHNAIAEPTVLETGILNHYSDKIEIVYAIDNNNTRHLRETYPAEFKAAVDALCGMVRGKCIAVANEDVALPERFERLTHNVHGMNKYTSYNSVMFLSALNIDPETQAILTRVLDADAFDVYLDRTVSIAYQVIMRGALRLMKQVDEYKIFVMDKQLAESLRAVYFHNATVTGLDGYSIKLKPRGRPKGTATPMTNSERKKAMHMRKLAESGYYDAMTSNRILTAKGASMRNMTIWYNVDEKGKLLGK